MPLSHLPNLPLQELPADLTAEQACSPACSELVGSMCTLPSNLMVLSHLDDAGPQQVGGRVPGAAGKSVLLGAGAMNGRYRGASQQLLLTDHSGQQPGWR